MNKGIVINRLPQESNPGTVQRLVDWFLHRSLCMPTIAILFLHGTRTPTKKTTPSSSSARVGRRDVRPPKNEPLASPKSIDHYSALAPHVTPVVSWDLVGS